MKQFHPQITLALRCSVKASRGRYNAFLEEQEKNNKDKQKSRKWKVIGEDPTKLKITESLLGNTISKLHESW